MLHGSAGNTEKDASSEWKAKLGIKLFWLYCVIYTIFVAIAVFSTQTMKKPVLAGANLAIVFGMALILFAVILGLIYNYVCTKKEDEMNGKKEDA